MSNNFLLHLKVSVVVLVKDTFGAAGSGGERPLHISAHAPDQCARRKKGGSCANSVLYESIKDGYRCLNYASYGSYLIQMETIHSRNHKWLLVTVIGANVSLLHVLQTRQLRVEAATANLRDTSSGEGTGGVELAPPQEQQRHYQTHMYDREGSYYSLID